MAALSLKATPKGVTALIITAVLILFGCVLGYLAAAGKLSSALSEMEAKAKSVDESREIAQKLEASKLAYLDARSQVRYLEASVSTQEYVPTLLKQLEQLGRSVNLKVLGVRPSQEKQKTSVKRSISSGREASEDNIESASAAKPEADGKPARKTEPYDELKVEIQLQGRYMDALDFLYKLTSFPKIIAVDEVEMSPPANMRFVSGSPALTMKLKVTAYVLKDDTRPADGPPGRHATPRSRKVVAG